MNPKFICNVIISVAFIATFIGVFFFTYAKKIEQDIVKEQTASIVHDIVGDLKVFVADDAMPMLTMLTSQIPTPDMSGADAEAAENNAALLKKATKVIIIGNLIAAAAIYYFYNQQPFDIVDMLKHNAIILMFVGVTEFVFLTYVARYFISADPNMVKYHVVKTLNEYLKSH